MALGRLAQELARPGIALACLQAANAEVGTVQPVPEAHQLCAAAGVPLLVDGAAAVGQVLVPSSWDALVASARAWGSPAETGLLVLRAGTRWLSPYPEHDGTERTPDFPGVPAAMAAAAALHWLLARRAEQDRRRRVLLEQVRRAAAAVPDVEVVGDPEHCLPHVLTFSCLFVDGEVLAQELDGLGLAVGSGSACTASDLRPSHVLAAMGVLTHGNVRIGLPVQVEPEQVSRLCRELGPAVRRVRDRLGAVDL